MGNITPLSIIELDEHTDTEQAQSEFYASHIAQPCQVAANDPHYLPWEIVAEQPSFHFGLLGLDEQ